MGMIVIRVKVLAVMIRPGIIGLRRRWISAGPETQLQQGRTKISPGPRLL